MATVPLRLPLKPTKGLNWPELGIPIPGHLKGPGISVFLPQTEAEFPQRQVPAGHSAMTSVEKGGESLGCDAVVVRSGGVWFFQSLCFGHVLPFP